MSLLDHKELEFLLIFRVRNLPEFSYENSWDYWQLSQYIKFVIDFQNMFCYNCLNFGTIFWGHLSMLVAFYFDSRVNTIAPNGNTNSIGPYLKVSAFLKGFYCCCKPSWNGDKNCLIQPCHLLWTPAAIIVGIPTWEIFTSC